MISAPTGPSQNVKGSTIAMVVSGPMPGSTPMMVPSRQPMKQSSRFCQVSATAKPIPILPRKPVSAGPTPSKRSISEHRRPQRDRHFQREDEDADIDGDQHRRERREPQRPQQRAGGARQNGGDRERADEADGLEQEREGKRRERDQQQRFPGPAFGRLARADQARGGERAAERDQQRANRARKVARAHVAGGPEIEIAGEPQDG